MPLRCRRGANFALIRLAKISGDDLRVRADLVRWTVSNLAAVIEDDDAVRDVHHDPHVVLDYGRKIADGPPDEARASPEVIAAYLGEPDHGEVGAAPATLRRSVAM